MARLATTAAIFLLLSAWAGAQGPAPLLASDQIRLLRANRVLLGDLINHGVELGTTDDPLQRASACQGAAHALGVALRRAAEANDPDRVAELGGHLEEVIREGLVPILNEAKSTIPPDSKDAVRLKTIQASAAEDLGSIRSALPLGDATDARLLDVGTKLDNLREQLK